jgi:hypothetical protein
VLKVVKWDDDDAITHPLRMRGDVITSQWPRITSLPQWHWIPLLSLLLLYLLFPKLPWRHCHVDVFTIDVRLYTCNDSRMTVQIVMKFVMDVMPFEGCPKWYFLDSWNLKYQLDMGAKSWDGTDSITHNRLRMRNDVTAPDNVVDLDRWCPYTHM